MFFFYFRERIQSSNKLHQPSKTQRTQENNQAFSRENIWKTIKQLKYTKILISNNDCLWSWKGSSGTEKTSTIQLEGYQLYLQYVDQRATHENACNNLYQLKTLTTRKIIIVLWTIISKSIHCHPFTISSKNIFINFICITMKINSPTTYTNELFQMYTI